MKHSCFIIFFTFCCYSVFSQTTRQDTLNDIQELRLVREQITEKVILLNKGVMKRQQLLDSLKSKSDTLNEEIKRLKSSVSARDKKTLDQVNKKLKTLDKQLDNEIRTYKDDKEVLEKANNLINEIDLKLAQLAGKTT
jgi:hypothetical protein